MGKRRNSKRNTEVKPPAKLGERGWVEPQEASRTASTGRGIEGKSSNVQVSKETESRPSTSKGAQSKSGVFVPRLIRRSPLRDESDLEASNPSRTGSSRSHDAYKSSSSGSSKRARIDLSGQDMPEFYARDLGQSSSSTSAERSEPKKKGKRKKSGGAKIRQDVPPMSSKARMESLGSHGSLSEGLPSMATTPASGSPVSSTHSASLARTRTSSLSEQQSPSVSTDAASKDNLAKVIAAFAAELKIMNNRMDSVDQRLVELNERLESNEVTMGNILDLTMGSSGKDDSRRQSFESSLRPAGEVSQGQLRFQEQVEESGMQVDVSPSGEGGDEAYAGTRQSSPLNTNLEETPPELLIRTSGSDISSSEHKEKSPTNISPAALEEEVEFPQSETIADIAEFVSAMVGKEKTVPESRPVTGGLAAIAAIDMQRPKAPLPSAPVHPSVDISHRGSQGSRLSHEYVDPNELEMLGRRGKDPRRRSMRLTFADTKDPIRSALKRTGSLKIARKQSFRSYVNIDEFTGVDRPPKDIEMETSVKQKVRRKSFTPETLPTRILPSRVAKKSSLGSMQSGPGISPSAAMRPTTRSSMATPAKQKPSIPPTPPTRFVRSSHGNERILEMYVDPVARESTTSPPPIPKRLTTSGQSKAPENVPTTTSATSSQVLPRSAKNKPPIRDISHSIVESGEEDIPPPRPGKLYPDLPESKPIDPAVRKRLYNSWMSTISYLRERRINQLLEEITERDLDFEFLRGLPLESVHSIEGIFNPDEYPDDEAYCRRIASIFALLNHFLSKVLQALTSRSAAMIVVRMLVHPVIKKQYSLGTAQKNKYVKRNTEKKELPLSFRDFLILFGFIYFSGSEQDLKGYYEHLRKCFTEDRHGFKPDVKPNSIYYPVQEALKERRRMLGIPEPKYSSLQQYQKQIEDKAARQMKKSDSSGSSGSNY